MHAFFKQEKMWMVKDCKKLFLGGNDIITMSPHIFT